MLANIPYMDPMGMQTCFSRMIIADDDHHSLVKHHLSSVKSKSLDHSRTNPGLLWSHICVYPYMKGSFLSPNYIIINPGGLATAWQPFWLPDSGFAYPRCYSDPAWDVHLPPWRADASPARRTAHRERTTRRKARTFFGGPVRPESLEEWRNHDKHRRIWEYMVISMVIM
jgi:hypothetical protein